MSSRHSKQPAWPRRYRAAVRPHLDRRASRCRRAESSADSTGTTQADCGEQRPASDREHRPTRDASRRRGRGKLPQLLTATRSVPRRRPSPSSGFGRLTRTARARHDDEHEHDEEMSVTRAPRDKSVSDRSEQNQPPPVPGPVKPTIALWPVGRGGCLPKIRRRYPGDHRPLCGAVPRGRVPRTAARSSSKSRRRAGGLPAASTRRTESILGRGPLTPTPTRASARCSAGRGRSSPDESVREESWTRPEP